MYEVMIEEEFSAAHALRGYRGKCENHARPQLES